MKSLIPWFALIGAIVNILTVFTHHHILNGPILTALIAFLYFSFLNLDWRWLLLFLKSLYLSRFFFIFLINYFIWLISIGSFNFLVIRYLTHVIWEELLFFFRLILPILSFSFSLIRLPIKLFLYVLINVFLLVVSFPIFSDRVIVELIKHAVVGLPKFILLWSWINY